jgi:hypothetical protein
VLRYGTAVARVLQRYQGWLLHEQVQIASAATYIQHSLS